MLDVVVESVHIAKSLFLRSGLYSSLISSKENRGGEGLDFVYCILHPGVSWKTSRCFCKTTVVASFGGILWINDGASGVWCIYQTTGGWSAGTRDKREKLACREKKFHHCSHRCMFPSPSTLPPSHPKDKPERCHENTHQLLLFLCHRKKHFSRWYYSHDVGNWKIYMKKITGRMMILSLVFDSRRKWGSH